MTLVTEMAKTMSGAIDVRGAVIGTLEQLLLGPMNPDEVLESSPADTYLTGMLWPRGTMISAAEDDANATGGDVSDDDASMDDGIAGYRLMRPCSVGITFTVRGAGTLTISLAGTARYEPRQEDEDLEDPPPATVENVLASTRAEAAGAPESGPAAPRRKRRTKSDGSASRLNTACRSRSPRLPRLSVQRSSGYRTGRSLRIRRSGLTSSSGPWVVT